MKSFLKGRTLLSLKDRLIDRNALTCHFCTVLATIIAKITNKAVPFLHSIPVFQYFIPVFQHSNR